MTTFKLTWLEAVNKVLRAIGETPVSSLSDNVGVDVVMAEAALSDANREVQNVGWSFNRRRVTYSLDTDGKIPIPKNIARIKDPNGGHYTVRDNFLFSMSDGENTFSNDVTLDVVELLDWNDLPEACKTHVAVKASRRHADQQLGDPNLSKFTRQDEAETYQMLRKEDVDSKKNSYFGPDFYRDATRRSPIDRGYSSSY